MANNSIPIEDKKVVIQRLAEGQSTRQAIQGTCIKSNQTAARIAKNYSYAITQKRKSYLQKIEENVLTRNEYRAHMLSQMMEATKLVRYKDFDHKRIYGHSGPLREYVLQEPDWDIRLKAIKHIDALEGYTSGTGTQVNVMQQVNSS